MALVVLVLGQGGAAGWKHTEHVKHPVPIDEDSL